jgi:hypothetical protein
MAGVLVGKKIEEMAGVTRPKTVSRTLVSDVSAGSRDCLRSFRSTIKTAQNSSMQGLREPNQSNAIAMRMPFV